MKNCLVCILTSFCLFVSIYSNAQDINLGYYNYGVWQTFGQPVSTEGHSEIRGRLCNFRWADLEKAPGRWDWSEFDYELSIRAADSLPVIFMVYTKEDAPKWLYSNGVPKVIERNIEGKVIGHAPYYTDSDYKFYFKRMITKVREHIGAMPPEIRIRIIAVQACFGNTGDFISYKGEVKPEYDLTKEQFDALFEEFSLYYYNEYRNAAPKIYLLSNPSNNGEGQMRWLIKNCPGGWIKTGSIGKGYQLNDEAEKASWLFNILNYPQSNGEYVRARCEITGDGVNSGWWSRYTYRNMFALMCYGIHWGLDWSNQTNNYLFDHNYDSAFFFYNRYAGAKIPAKSRYAMCALKDVIDASDIARFPESQYGPATRTKKRFKSVLTPFEKYGALLEDPANAILSETDNISATGINDVGWNLLPGNYERYLHQIDPIGTSVGHWNVNSADINSMYGRFARGFEVKNGKDQMYFDVEDAFLNNTAINGTYPIIIEIVYLDKGTGKWQLFYDSKTALNKGSIVVTCTNSGLWKKAVVNLTDANFGNRGPRNCDFSIKALNSENVIFSIIELARPGKGQSDIGLHATPLTPFDTICVNGVSEARSFILSGAFLTISTVVVGPAKGYKFSDSADGVYKNSFTIEDINSAFSKEVYVKFYPEEEGSYNNNIPVKGDDILLQIPGAAQAVNSSPQLKAAVGSVTCYGDRDGAIDLRPTGGEGPFTFSWTNDDNSSFKSSEEDISDLYSAVFTVVVKSFAGCSVTASFAITEPDPLETTLKYDDMLCKGGITNLYVSAKGGILPYQGTGTFQVAKGNGVYTVTDANGCSDKENVNIPNGTLEAPDKPEQISPASKDEEKGVCGEGSFTYSVDKVSDATFYSWYAPFNSSIGPEDDGASAILTTNRNFKGGELSVAAGNACGLSNLRSITITTEPAPPQTISGPAFVDSRESDLSYAVDKVPGVTYTWSVPPGAIINSGQGTHSIEVTWGNTDGNVKVSAANDCGASSNSAYFVTIGSSSVVMQESSSAVTGQPKPFIVYPNPAHDHVNISFSSTKKGNCSIELTDLAGRSLMRRSYEIVKGNNNLTLDLKQYTNGIYMLRIIDENGREKTIKIIKD